MKKLVIALVFLMIIFSIANMLISGSFLFYPSYQGISSRSITGVISFFVEGGFSFLLLSPENITYNFSKGDIYFISLNVSTDSDVSSWAYTLHDLKHDIIINENEAFVLNTTIIAVRWSNNLTVYANRSDGEQVQKSVTFSVYIPNSAPVLEPLSCEYLICEGSSFYLFFNATDVDEDSLTAHLSPLNLFYVTSSMTNINWTLRRSEIFSGTLHKSSIGKHQEILSVSDGFLSDSKNFNITVIEINHVPSIASIGVHTLYSRGENSTFEHQVEVYDVESGNNEGSGNFTFNLTFFSGTQFLRINNSGAINGSANSSLVGVYNISVCVNDSGLSSPHINISLCGSTGNSLTGCINFSLTITDANRVPTITSYYSANTTPLILGDGGSVIFNITKHDPDGTIPDTYWYLDDILDEIDSGSVSDFYSLSFSACSLERHTLKGVITDGLANDSIQWNITVTPGLVCAGAGGGGGGAGGAGFQRCSPLWGCGLWTNCRFLDSALKKGTIFGKTYREIHDLCVNSGLSDPRCGFETRICTDIKSCNSTLNKPEEFEACYYTLTPTCADGIKNCHDNNCEVLTDCGGPCAPCATCSDGIQNQKEEGVDCGGPCDLCRIEEKQKAEYNIYFIFVLIILFILILVFIIRMLRLKKLLKTKPLDNF